MINFSELKIDYDKLISYTYTFEGSCGVGKLIMKDMSIRIEVEGSLVSFEGTRNETVFLEAVYNTKDKTQAFNDFLAGVKRDASIS